MEQAIGTLLVVATPIGNLEDITLRGLRVLREADVIACEDTRTTKKLLAHYQIDTPTISFHAHSGAMKVDKILELLEDGKHVALVTDAGTPAISDPGALLVAQVRERLPYVRIEAIPGASAVTAALSVSGISGSDFVFLGFLPHKKGRETLFREIAESERTTVLYESPHRIQKTLESLVLHCPERMVVLARELTKLHETILSGTPEELRHALTEDPHQQKGEFVVLIAPAGQ